VHTLTKNTDFPNGSYTLGQTSGSVFVYGTDLRVWRIDPETNKVDRHTDPVGEDNSRLSAGGGMVWVRLDGIAVRLDADTLTVRDRLPVAGGLEPVAGDRRGTWIADSDHNSIWHFDPLAKLVGTIPLPAVPLCIALTSTDVWVGSVEGSIIRIDRATDRVSEVRHLEHAISSLAYADGLLWAAVE
jgi:streptogramin lyase